MESGRLLSYLIDTNVRCMRLFQWFYDVELCMDMNSSYNNTNRLFPLPPGEGQGEGVSGIAVSLTPLLGQLYLDPVADITDIAQLDAGPVHIRVLRMVAVQAQQFNRSARTHPSRRGPRHAVEAVAVDIKRHVRVHLAFHQQLYIGGCRIARPVYRLPANMLFSETNSARITISNKVINT